jgi:hypothetical protein
MTKTVVLVHPNEASQVSYPILTQKCDLFTNNPTLTVSPYTPKSQVSLAEFREFVSALDGKTVTINRNNFKGLSQLCDEFGFRELSARLSEFTETHMRLSALEDQMQQREREIVGLQCGLSRQSQALESAEKRVRAEAESAFRQANEAQKAVGNVRREVEDLREMLKEVREFADSARMIALASQGASEGAQKKAESMEALLGRMERFEGEVSALNAAAVPAPARTPPRSMVPIQKPALTQTSITSSTSIPTAPLPPLLPPYCWNSAIVSDFPEIFAEFRGKRFSLLWRGGRDGFRTRDFHRRCDGHANTLTVILDTNGNIFGGFTPVKWELREWNGANGSEDNRFKADPSSMSFLFTLKNPHNLPAQRFALNEKKGKAILCDCGRGPHFCNIGIFNNCNANAKSFAYFDESHDHYTNDTGLDGKTLLTGSENFQVKEIEVFEITA